MQWIGGDSSVVCLPPRGGTRGRGVPGAKINGLRVLCVNADPASTPSPSNCIQILFWILPAEYSSGFCKMFIVYLSLTPVTINILLYSGACTVLHYIPYTTSSRASHQNHQYRITRSTAVIHWHPGVITFKLKPRHHFDRYYILQLQCEYPFLLFTGSSILSSFYLLKYL